jgi:NAD-dependent SIR2 family protein deacetylase
LPVAPTLKCSGCKNTLPRGEFYNNKSSRTGKCNYCKECVRSRYSTETETELGPKKERIVRARTSGEARVCSRCRQSKSRTDFYKNIMNRDGLMSWCKDCMKDNQKVRYQERNVRILPESESEFEWVVEEEEEEEEAPQEPPTLSENEIENESEELFPSI